METMDGTEKAPFREPDKTSPKGRLRQMKQEDGKGIGDPVHKYYSFPSEARDFSRGYFTQIVIVNLLKPCISFVYIPLYRHRFHMYFGKKAKEKPRR